MYAMVFTVIGMAIIGAYGIRWFSYILKINMYYLIPAVTVCAIFGAYSINNRASDVLVAVIAGIAAIVLVKFEFPLSPLIIGFVLSNLIEQNLRRTVQLADARHTGFMSYIVQRPLSLFLLILLVGLVMLFSLMNPNTKKKLQDE